MKSRGNHHDVSNTDVTTQADNHVIKAIIKHKVLKKQPTCYGCKKKGHYAKQCPNLYCSHYSIITTNEIAQFELFDCIIKVNKLSTRVVVVYRPPPSCKNGLKYEDFTVDWASYIKQFVEVQEELLIVGDFNIHVDSSNNESQSFLDILNANGLIQHVKSSTHQKGHILDLVITREHSNLLKRPPVVFISGVSNVKSSY